MSITTITTGYSGGNQVSRPGQQNGSGATDALFLKVFGEMVMEAWEQTGIYQNFVTTRTIPYGKQATFPIIGRKRDAQYHTPGELVTGGNLNSGEVVINVDGVLYDSLFVAEIDELMNHYEVQGPYARQLGESIALKFDAYASQLTALAARDTTPEVTGLPVGLVLNNPNVVTDADTLVRFAFRTARHIADNDIGGGTPRITLRPAQYFLLVQNTKVLYKEYGGSADISKGTVTELAGMEIVQAKGNRIANTDLSADTTIPAQYRGNFTNTVALASNPMAVGCLRVRGFKMTMDNQNDRFGTLMIASQVQGMGVLRQECAAEWSAAAGSD